MRTDNIGKNIYATILCTKVRNFSNIVNILSLGEIQSFLNDCYTCITESATKFEGTLDKFVNDTLLILFGRSASHTPFQAVHCALDIQKKTEEINIGWRKELNFLIEFDIGISTGEISVGRIGHGNIMKPTIIGKNVSLAVQLAQLCVEYNTNILLEKNTYDMTNNVFEFRYIDETLILGFTEKINLYTPITTRK